MQRASGSGPAWKTGMSQVQQAQLLEAQQKVLPAKAQYERGIEQMLYAMKMEQDAATKKWMQSEVMKWLSHAERLKHTIQPAARHPTVQYKQPTRQAGGAAIRGAAARAPQAAAAEASNDPLRAMIENEIAHTTGTQRFDDIKGLSQAKAALREAVVLPALRPDMFTGLRSAPRGLLVFGPPGNGKTMLAKALANECHATFFAISASSLTSKWVGESEKLVRVLFQVAQERQPAIIFMDEIDALLSADGGSGSSDSARRLLTEFLVQFDGVKSSQDALVFVMGATNRPEKLDEAVRRRLVRRIYIPLPELEARTSLIESLLAGQKHSLSQRELQQVGSMLEGYSGSDITAVVKDAAMFPLRETSFDELQLASCDDLRAINASDLHRSASSIKPCASPEELRRYEAWNAQFGENWQPSVNESSSPRRHTAPITPSSLPSVPQTSGYQLPAGMDPPDPGHVEMLRGDPSLAVQFDQVFGVGAAEHFLNGGSAQQASAARQSAGRPVVSRGRPMAMRANSGQKKGDSCVIC